MAGLLGAAPATVPNVTADGSVARNAFAISCSGCYTYEHLLLLSFTFVVKTESQDANLKAPALMFSGAHHGSTWTWKNQ
jgi:hypothetical protein